MNLILEETNVPGPSSERSLNICETTDQITDGWYGVYESSYATSAWNMPTDCVTPVLLDLAMYKVRITHFNKQTNNQSLTIIIIAIIKQYHMIKSVVVLNSSYNCTIVCDNTFI